MKKVSIYRCEKYDLDKIKNVISKSLKDLGGIEKYIDSDDVVLLKVNLLMKKTPEEATTTHPVFVQALAEILIEYGASVIIGDSPAGPFTESKLKSIYKASGMEDVANNTKAVLNNNLASFILDNPQGLLLKKFTAVDMLNDVTKVISVSKLKTHGMMTYTGAVKNMFGIVPGILKAEFHLNLSSYDNFAGGLVDICMGGAPVLSFMDGIIAMEGNGPSAGTPRNMNAVIVSESPYHLDKVACKIISLDYNDVKTIVESNKRNLCTMDLSDVELIGDDIEDFIVTDFKLATHAAVNPVRENYPVFVQNFVNKFIQPRPVFNYEVCTSCQICKRSCPAKVITMNDKNEPTINLKECIRCYCCQELCPDKAITIYKPSIFKILFSNQDNN